MSPRNEMSFTSRAAYQKSVLLDKDISTKTMSKYRASSLCSPPTPAPKANLEDIELSATFCPCREKSHAFHTFYGFARWAYVVGKSRLCEPLLSSFSC